MSRPKPGSLASRLGAPAARSVLVIEDEPDIATFLSAFFRASGTEVIHVDPASAAEAVERAAAMGPACILLDLGLRGTTGFDVLAALGADERVAHVPVLIVTADARSATQERAAALGAVGFVPKPFNVKDLYVAVRAIIDGTDEALLISAEDVAARLRDAVAVAGGATFAIVRLLGAPASPAVVDELAKRLSPGTGRAEVLGATGADELAILWAGEGAKDVAADLEAVLGDGNLDLALVDRTVAVSVRAGVASHPDHAATGEELYMAADAALAEAVESATAVVVAR